MLVCELLPDVCESYCWLFAQDYMSRAQHIEDRLVALCQEKTQLEAEYAKMPLHSGRSAKERQRKAVVEQRMEVVNKDISNLRLQLKKMHVHPK